MRRRSALVLALTAVVGPLLACRAGSSDRDERRGPAEAARVVETPGQITGGDPWPTGNLVASRFGFQLAVYYLPRPENDVETALGRLLESAHIRRAAQVPEGDVTAPVVVVGHPPVDEYPVPDETALEHFARGLSDAQKRALAETREVTTLTFLGPGAQAVATYHAAVELVAKLAVSTGGLPWDAETREIFALDAWNHRMQAWAGDIPDVRSHVTVHMYRDGELNRLVTLGMAKFALPDVVVNQVSKGNSEGMLSLVNLACQAFVEQKTIARVGSLPLALSAVKNETVRERELEVLRPGAKRRTTLRVSRGERQEGDADNRLAELVFPGPRSSLQTRHLDAITAVYGAQDDIVHVKHDQRLEAASKRARERLLKHKAHFEKGAPLGEELLVKAPFQTPDGSTEWMWVELVSWQGGVIHGILQNDPFDIPDLKGGARVQVEERLVFDYIWKRANGTTEGNETAKLLERNGRR